MGYIAVILSISV